MFFRILACLLLGYLFGNFQTSVFVGKKKNIDIRQYGSGNAGTTNAFRTLGKKAGIVTFFGDFLKAIIPILLIKHIVFPDIDYLQLLALYTGFGVVLGHNYPCWLKFKGGKGIAASAGVLLAFDPWVAIPGAVLFITSVAITRYVSVGSLLIALLYPAWITITLYDSPYYIHMLIIGFCFVISAYYKHRANIVRILNHTENKIGQRVVIDTDTHK